MELEYRFAARRLALFDFLFVSWNCFSVNFNPVKPRACSALTATHQICKPYFIDQGKIRMDYSCTFNYSLNIQFIPVYIGKVKLMKPPVAGWTIALVTYKPFPVFKLKDDMEIPQSTLSRPPDNSGKFAQICEEFIVF